MLSIRTQDRMALVPYDKRIKIYRITSKNHLNETVLTDKFEITLGGYPIGTYATKERALNVLDDIGRLLNDERNRYQNNVYQMPNE